MRPSSDSRQPGLLTRRWPWAAHANFPSTRPASRPVTRFGWDQCEFLRVATQAISDWHAYRRPLGQRVLTVRREDEVPALQP
jgi:hypothetical protein